MTLSIDGWLEFYLEAEKFYELGGHISLADPTTDGEELDWVYTYSRTDWKSDHVSNLWYEETVEYIDRTQDDEPEKTLALRKITEENEDDWDGFGPGCLLLAFELRDPGIYFVKTDIEDLPVFYMRYDGELFKAFNTLAAFKAALKPCENPDLADAELQYGWDTSDAIRDLYLLEKDALLAFELAACTGCQTFFATADIVKWRDDRQAHCPHCEALRVVPNTVLGEPLTAERLEKLEHVKPY